MAFSKQSDVKKKDLCMSTSSRERQWTEFSHRRLRHLHGITIRNLTLTHQSSRARGRTIDDEAVPSTLQSPTKIINPKFSSRLGHANSSLNLKEAGKAEAAIGDATYRTKPPPRLLQGQLKRRITSEWSNASPLDRQRRLEDVISTRMLDTFFSLHVADIQEPIYISEVTEKTINPDFRFFDLTPQPASVTRKDSLIIRIWAKNERHDDYQYAIEEKIDLASLRFVGKGLEAYRYALPHNCVFFHLSDGLYTSNKDVKLGDGIESGFGLTSHKVDQYLLSSTYDSLMRLSALDECIQDALRIREKLVGDIDRILTRHNEMFSKINRKPEVYEAVKSAWSAVIVQRRRLQQAIKKRSEFETQIRIRRVAIENGQKFQDEEQLNLRTARQRLSQRKLELEQLQRDIAGQRRRVCFDLADIYPIDPVPDKSFSFSIRGLELPKASFDGFSSSQEDTVIAAALGYVAHVVSLLSIYLSYLLPYPVSSMCSTSSVFDALAMTAGIRTYPLFPRSGPRFRFEYGVFLLNKNIEMLTARLDAKVLDIRHTLANLKFVLYLVTAGEGELPARKVGGVKGLLLRRSLAVDASGPSSRPNSDLVSESSSPTSSQPHRARYLGQDKDTPNDENSSDADSERTLTFRPRFGGHNEIGKVNGNASGPSHSDRIAEKGSRIVGKALKGTL